MTKNGDPLIKLFEELGFAVIHKKENIDGVETNRSARMKNPDGFYIDVSETQSVPQETTLIRINVDNFDEAYDMLKDKGFVNVNGDHIIKTDSSIAAVMVSPSGFAVDIIKHIKKDSQ
jgi:hypothetical protein